MPSMLVTSALLPRQPQPNPSQTAELAEANREFSNSVIKCGRQSNQVTQNQMTEFLTRQKLAEKLGLSERTIAGLQKSKKIPAIVLNRKTVLYNYEAVIAALKGAEIC